MRAFNQAVLRPLQLLLLTNAHAFACIYICMYSFSFILYCYYYCLYAALTPLHTCTGGVHCLPTVYHRRRRLRLRLRPLLKHGKTLHSHKNRTLCALNRSERFQFPETTEIFLPPLRSAPVQNDTDALRFNLPRSHCTYANVFNQQYFAHLWIHSSSWKAATAPAPDVYVFFS